MPLSGSQSIALDQVPSQLLSFGGEPQLYQLFPRSGTLTTITAKFVEIGTATGSLTAQVWYNALGQETLAPLSGASCTVGFATSNTCTMSIPIVGGTAAFIVITNVGSVPVFGVAEVGLAVT
jgi:hypothetical protein